MSTCHTHTHIRAGVRPHTVSHDARVVPAQGHRTLTLSLTLTLTLTPTLTRCLHKDIGRIAQCLDPHMLGVFVKTVLRVVSYLDVTRETTARLASHSLEPRLAIYRCCSASTSSSSSTGSTTTRTCCSAASSPTSRSTCVSRRANLASTSVTSTQLVARSCVSQRPEYFTARSDDRARRERAARSSGAPPRRRQCDLRAEHEGAGVQHIIPVSRLPLK
eukprot:scaffold13930_cov65-Phaeocystis_antarctica.AAC.3